MLARFPELRFGLLEGGVGWACNLLTDAIGHWEKRQAPALLDNVRPTNIDRQQLVTLFSEYGGEMYRDKMGELIGSLSTMSPFRSLEELTEREAGPPLDDFAAAGIESSDDLRALFAERFTFGCEADDVTTAWAFDKSGNHRLNPMFSSDVGHWDVADIRDILPGSCKLVERDYLAEQDLREFMADNPIGLHGKMNLDFWKGTVV